MAVLLQILAEWYSYDIDLEAVHKLLDHCIMLNIVYTRNTGIFNRNHREGDAISTGCLSLSRVGSNVYFCNALLHFEVT